MIATVPFAVKKQPMGRPSANDRLGLYHALKSHVHALGLSWDSKGGNNGDHAPFAWRNA